MNSTQASNKRSGCFLWLTPSTSGSTHNAFDFGVVAASPLAFPIAWHNSKIPVYAVRVSVPNFHGFTGLVVLSGVAARYFPVQVGGVPFLPAPGVFRIDH